MSHKSHAELSAMLRDAEKHAPTGTHYTHYKNPLKHYTIIGHSILEASDEVGIMYQAEYGDRLIFVRSLSSWCAKVKNNGKYMPRFSRKE